MEGFARVRAIGSVGGGDTADRPSYSAFVSDRRSPVPHSGPPRIGDLIDLERALERDREQPIEVLLGRDARIGREIDAARRDDRGLLFAWLERVQGRDSIGEGVEALLRLVSVVLVAAGLVSGALGVAGWLWSGGGAPVNVVQLWPTLIGVQFVLAIGWVGVRLVSGRIRPGLPVGLSTLLPAALGGLVARLAKTAWRDAWQRFRALDRVYGGVAFWRITRITQSFAVAFNLGALVALFFIPTIDDPAFGWRSRLLDAEELQTLTSVIATPWAGIWPDALPTRAEIEATEGSSLGPSPGPAGQSGRSEVWAAWWPFLVASFLVYGLAPRLLLRVFAGLRLRRLLRSIAFDHEGCVRVRERLRHHAVDGRADVADSTSVRDGSLDANPLPLALPTRVCALRWAGVPALDAAALSTRLASAHGVMVERLETVGGLDLAADERALEAMRGAPAVLVLVEAWEAPGADYVDLLRRLRDVIGERAPLIVLPCELGVDGRGIAVDASHLSLWRRRLASLADPWLRVDPFPAETIR